MGYIEDGFAGEEGLEAYGKEKSLANADDRLEGFLPEAERLWKGNLPVLTKKERELFITVC